MTTDNDNRSKWEYVFYVVLVCFILFQGRSVYLIIFDITGYEDNVLQTILGWIVLIIGFFYTVIYKQIRTYLFFYQIATLIMGIYLIYAWVNQPQTKLEIYNNCYRVRYCSPFYTEFIVMNNGDALARNVHVTLQLDDMGIDPNYYGSSAAFDVRSIENYQISVYPKEEMKNISVTTNIYNRNNTVSEDRFDLKHFGWPQNTYSVALDDMQGGDFVKIRIYAPINGISEFDSRDNFSITNTIKINDLVINKYESRIKWNIHSKEPVITKYLDKYENRDRLELILEQVIRDKFLHSGSFFVQTSCFKCINSKDKVYIPMILSLFDTLFWADANNRPLVKFSNSNTLSGDDIIITYYAKQPLLPEQWSIPLEINLTKYSEKKILNVPDLNSIFFLFIDNPPDVNVIDADIELLKKYRFRYDETVKKVYVCYAERVKIDDDTEKYKNC